jgi:single-strand DNA-binding protein
MNICFLIGRLTRDPKMSETNDGTPIAEFGLAVDRLRDGAADFVDITVFGARAKSCGDHIAKGRQVAIEGALRYQRWTDKQTGEPRSKLDVVARNVKFLAPPKNHQPTPDTDGDQSAEPDEAQVEPF